MCMSDLALVQFVYALLLRHSKSLHDTSEIQSYTIFSFTVFSLLILSFMSFSLALNAHY
ncbi:hypothetical protein ALT1000_140044 [Alteromonas macleodii]